MLFCAAGQELSRPERVKAYPMRTHSTWLLATTCVLLLGTSVRAEDPEELPSYVLLQDSVVTADKAAADAVFYSYDEKVTAAKLKELGTEWPKGFNFPQGSLFVIAVYGYTKESFASMSAVKSSRTFIVNLQTDKDTAQLKPAAEGKKNVRVLLIGCPPIHGIKAWAIKTSDAKVHAVEGAELKK
jgi:hypothetical protein